LRPHRQLPPRRLQLRQLQRFRRHWTSGHRRRGMKSRRQPLLKKKLNSIQQTTL
jgi:hypothetical protein